MLVHNCKFLNKKDLLILVGLFYFQVFMVKDNMETNEKSKKSSTKKVPVLTPEEEKVVEKLELSVYQANGHLTRAQIRTLQRLGRLPK